MFLVASYENQSKIKIEHTPRKSLWNPRKAYEILWNPCNPNVWWHFPRPTSAPALSGAYGGRHVFRTGCVRVKRSVVTYDFLGFAWEFIAILTGFYLKIHLDFIQSVLWSLFLAFMAWFGWILLDLFGLGLALARFGLILPGFWLDLVWIFEFSVVFIMILTYV